MKYKLHRAYFYATLDGLTEELRYILDPQDVFSPPVLQRSRHY